MKLRQAEKIRDKIHYGGRKYRKTTVARMRRRLIGTEKGTDATLWFEDLMDEMCRKAPIEFASLQFKCGMSLAEMLKERRQSKQELEPC